MPRRFTSSSSRGVRWRFIQTKLLPEASFWRDLASRRGRAAPGRAARRCRCASRICFGSAKSDGVSSVVASRTPLRSTMSARARGAARRLRAARMRVSPPSISVTSTRRSADHREGKAEERRGDEKPRVAGSSDCCAGPFGRNGRGRRVGLEMARAARIFVARCRLASSRGTRLEIGEPRGAAGTERPAAAQRPPRRARLGHASGMASRLPSCLGPIGRGRDSAAPARRAARAGQEAPFGVEHAHRLAVCGDAAVEARELVLLLHHLVFDLEHGIADGCDPQAQRIVLGRIMRRLPRRRRGALGGAQPRRAGARIALRFRQRRARSACA